MINLHFIEGNVYVWKSEDWAFLRRNRIVGQLVGQRSNAPRQNNFNGLPLVLLKEETTLLIEKGMGVIQDYPALKIKPSEEEKIAHNQFLEADYNLQVQNYKQKRIKKLNEKIDMIVKGKKKKLSKRKLNGDHVINIDKATILKEEINKIEPLKKSDVQIKIYTCHPWFGKTLSEVNNVVRLLHWNYPKTKLDSIKYKVFKCLWEKGLYLTPGLKFGGDFLVYPGDPLKYHSHFIVICKDYSSEIHVPDLISLVRLGNTVRKTIVLAFTDENDHLIFYSINWSGINL